FQRSHQSDESGLTVSRRDADTRSMRIPFQPAGLARSLLREDQWPTAVLCSTPIDGKPRQVKRQVEGNDQVASFNGLPEDSLDEGGAVEQLERKLRGKGLYANRSVVIADVVTEDLALTGDGVFAVKDPLFLAHVHAVDKATEAVHAKGQ